MSSEESLEDVQREVQRKVGRNLIHLQQYELLVKALVVDQSVAGYMDELESARECRVSAVAKKTLGQLHGELTSTLLVPASSGSSSGVGGDSPECVDRPWFRFSFQIAMSPEEFQRTKGRLDELKEMRNDLVHHFLEKFDLGARDGCLGALRYLDVCLEQIIRHYEELRGWVKSHLEARQYFGRVILESQEMQDLLLHGILPGNAGVAWQHSTVVRLLREAEANLAVGGWTGLNDAIEYVRGREPEHIPSKYGCRTWRQVLHESRQFELRKDRCQPDEATVTYYRSRRGDQTTGD